MVCSTAQIQAGPIPTRPALPASSAPSTYPPASTRAATPRARQVDFFFLAHQAPAQARHFWKPLALLIAKISCVNSSLNCSETTL